MNLDMVRKLCYSIFVISELLNYQKINNMMFYKTRLSKQVTLHRVFTYIWKFEQRSEVTNPLSKVLFHELKKKKKNH